MTDTDAPSPGLIPLRPVSPPTQPGPIAAPPPPPAWPIAIGIISIVLGMGGSLMNLWGTFAPLVSLLVLESHMSAQDLTSIGIIRAHLPWQVTAFGLAAATSVLLCIGGIMLVRQSRRSPKVCLAWAMVKMPLTVGVAVLHIMLQQAQWAAMAGQQQQAPAAFNTTMRVMMYVGLVFGIAWGWALPIFMLLWFTRKRIAQQVAQWA